MSHDNEDIARTMRNWNQFVKLPTECNAGLQIAIIQALEEIDLEGGPSGIPNSAKAFRIHRAIVDALKD